MSKYINEFDDFVNEKYGIKHDDIHVLEKEIVGLISNESYFEYDELHTDFHDELLFITRENGSVGGEEASQVDIDEALRLKKLIQNKYKLEVNVEVVDEWVHINISNIDDVDEFIYKFKKDYKGAGFTGSFNSMDELIDRYGTWVKVDWDSVVTKLDNIESFPHNLFTGWHNSRPILISKIGDEGNDMGYNFYVIKSKKD